MKDHCKDFITQVMLQKKGNKKKRHFLYIHVFTTEHMHWKCLTLLTCLKMLIFWNKISKLKCFKSFLCVWEADWELQLKLKHLGSWSVAPGVEVSQNIKTESRYVSWRLIAAINWELHYNESAENSWTVQCNHWTQLNAHLQYGSSWTVSWTVRDKTS